MTFFDVHRYVEHFEATSEVLNETWKKNNEIVDLKDPANPTFDFESLYDTKKSYLVKASGISLTSRES